MVATIKRGATQATIKKVLAEVSKRTASKGVDTHKFCGKIELKEDPLEIQKRLRDEWE